MTSLKNKNIESFIQEQLKLIEPFRVIDLPLNDNIIEPDIRNDLIRISEDIHNGFNES